MKIALVKPNIGRLEHSLFVDEARMEPLELGVLAALTPPDVEVVLYDDRVEPIPYDEPVDLAAISVQIFTARRGYEIAGVFRSRRVPVVIGGIHASLLPEEAAEHADAVVVGDAEGVWARVVEDARQGRLEPMYISPPGIPQPGLLTRRDVFKGKGYLPLTLLQFSRGCRFRCSFCAISAYFNETQFCRPVAEVAAEIKAAKTLAASTLAQGHLNLFFVDDNILSDHEAAKKLFRALIPLEVRWVSQGTIDMTTDRELMDLMVRSGCLGHVIGFESILPESLEEMNKGAALAGGFEGYERHLDVLREYGLQTWAAFTIGHDHDTLESIERTLDFALQNRFTFAAFNVLMPYPNTPLYRRLEAEGRLLYGGRWWLHPEYRFNHAAFIPKNMTADELTAAGLRCRKVFNSIPSILRRAWDTKTNMRSLYRLGIYAVYSRLFRQETFKKQGMRLGLEE